VSGHVPIGPGREFDLVRAMLHRWGDRAHGIGDDAAVLDVPPGEQLVVTTDVAVETVHFRRDWMSPQEIGYRTTAAALSDLAAMAATPRGLVLGLTIPRDWTSTLADFADGVGAAAADVSCPIVGGDVTSGHEIVVTVTAFGSTRAPLRRSNAEPGDTVYVTGALGGPATAVRALEQGRDPTPMHRERLVHPRPRIREALWLVARGAHAGIDISDGLSSELLHLAAASDVAIEIALERVPVLEGCAVADAVAGGEEYELLVTAPTAFDTTEFRAAFDLALTAIGAVASRGAPRVVATRDGNRVDLAPGYDHFSP
jgi:thiamine-monophosphate kinase